MELAGWPEVYVYMAREFGFSPKEVNELTMIQLAMFLGAITPDHQIQKLPMQDYMRLTSTWSNRQNLKRVHGR